jgi:hypothetical protein
MEQSEKIDLLSKALIAVQKELKPVTKEAVNPFFKSKYADLAGVIEHSTPVLSKNGLAVSQICEGEYGVTTILMHESGQWIKGTLNIKPAKDDPQGRGSALTYARRYSLSSIINLASEDDDDANSATHEPVKKKIDSKESNEEVNQGIEEIQKATTLERVTEVYEGFRSNHASGKYSDNQLDTIRNAANKKAQSLKGKK